MKKAELGVVVPFLLPSFLSLLEVTRAGAGTTCLLSFPAQGPHPRSSRFLQNSSGPSDHTVSRGEQREMPPWWRSSRFFFRSSGYSLCCLLGLRCKSGAAEGAVRQQMEGSQTRRAVCYSSVVSTGVADDPVVVDKRPDEMVPPGYITMSSWPQGCQCQSLSGLP